MGLLDWLKGLFHKETIKEDDKEEFNKTTSINIKTMARKTSVVFHLSMLI